MIKAIFKLFAAGVGPWELAALGAANW